jgi:hypothetical protein
MPTFLPTGEGMSIERAATIVMALASVGADLRGKSQKRIHEDDLEAYRVMTAFLRNMLIDFNADSQLLRGDGTRSTVFPSSW